MNLEKKTSVSSYLKTSSKLKQIIAIAAVIVLSIVFAMNYKIIKSFVEGVSDKDIARIMLGVFMIFLMAMLYYICDNSLRKTLKYSLIGITLFALMVGFLEGIGYLTYIIAPNFTMKLFEEGTSVGFGEYGVVGFIVTMSFIIIIALSWLLWVAILKNAFNTLKMSRWSIKLFKKSTYIPITKEELKNNNINSPNELENFFVKELFKDIKRGKGLDTEPIEDAIFESYKNSIELLGYKIGKENLEKMAWKMCENLIDYLEGDNNTLGKFDKIFDKKLYKKLKNN